MMTDSNEAEFLRKRLTSIDNQRHAALWEASKLKILLNEYRSQFGRLSHEDTVTSLVDVLRECEAYFDNRADADCDQDGFIPNEEMKLLSEVRDALAKAEAK